MGWMDRATPVNMASNAPIEQSKPAGGWMARATPLDSTQPEQGGIYSQYVKPILKPTVETLGTIGGGMAGLASPIPGGTIAGAGLGFAGAKKGYEALEQLFGAIPPQGLQESMAQIPSDIATGAASEMGGQVLGKLLGPALKGLSERMAFSAANPTKGQVKALKGMGQTPENIGNVALKENIVSGNKEKYLEGVKAVKESAGKGIDEALTGLDTNYAKNAAKMSKTELVHALGSVQKSIRSTPRGSVAYTPSDVNVLDDVISAIKENPNDTITYRELNDYITGISDRVKNFGLEQKGSQSVLREGRTALKGAMEKKLDKLAQQMEDLGVPEAKQLVNDKRRYAAMATLQDILEGSVAGEQTRAMLKPWDFSAFPLGFGLPFAARAFNKYGAAGMANIGNKIQPMFQSGIPEILGRELPILGSE